MKGKSAIFLSFFSYPIPIDIFAVPAKRSSHYIKGVVIGAMSTMGLVLVILLAFLWTCLLAKKERAAKRYTEVKKQVDSEPSKSSRFSKIKYQLDYSTSPLWN